MKERPILFSAPMVRAILDGSKMQTRRAVKPQPQPNGGKGLHPVAPYNTCTGDWNWVLAATGHGCGDPFKCPYGKPGDRLWVRETFIGWWNSADSSLSHVAALKADGYELEPGERWTPSLHMPRKASRINLEITGVRVERLQDISEADAIDEGISVWPGSERRGVKWHCPPHVRRYGEGENIEDAGFEGRPVKDPREAYRGVWSAINGAGSWEANPWVWVVEFRRVA